MRKIFAALLLFSAISLQLFSQDLSKEHFENGLRKMQANGELRWEGNIIIVYVSKADLPFYKELYTNMLKNTPQAATYTIAFQLKDKEGKIGKTNVKDLILIHEVPGAPLSQIEEDQQFFTKGRFVLKTEGDYRYLFSEYRQGTVPLPFVTVQPFYSDTARQFWTFEPEPGGYYKIKNGAGKYLEVHGTALSQTLSTMDKRVSDGQLWQLIYTQNDNYHIVSKSGNYLSFFENNRPDANALSAKVNTQAPFENNVHFRWQMIKVTDEDAVFTGFSPSTHGFRFINAFAGEDFIRWGGLCGGMSYAALDYYYHQVTTPTQSWIPANATALQSYIWNRQQHSMWDVHEKWSELDVNVGGSRTSEYFYWGTQGFGGGRLQEFKEEINASHAVPLGLYGSTGNIGVYGRGGGKHVVVGYGYAMGRYKGDHRGHQQDYKMYIWNPNNRNVKSRLIPNIAGLCYFELETGYTWHSYFVNRERANSHTPPLIPQFPERQPEGSIGHLYAEFSTGGDDLRSDSKLDLTINYTDGSQQHFTNINNSARWTDMGMQGVHLALNRNIRRSDIRSFLFVVHRGFNHPLGMDNWNLDRVSVSTGNGGIILADSERARRSDYPFYRFTAQQNELTLETLR